MTGDYTRDTFRPARGYSAVRMQQGRLLTDADWNEQGDIQRHALRTTTRAVVGASGFPEDNPGFAIVAMGAEVRIGGGEAYVDGIRVDHPAPARLQLRRVSGAGAATRWQLDGGTRVRVGDILVSPLAPAVAARVSEVHPDADGRQQFQCIVALSAANEIAVDRYHSLASQPFHPAIALPQAAGAYLFYLDVWERPIGAGEDPLLRETAFGGPDTAGRDQIVWQVKVAALGDLVAAGALVQPASCKSFGPGWTPYGNAARGRMAARAEAVAAATDPCALPTSGGYRSLENHLYRVEIHNGGVIAGGAVTVKWSRDNAIHTASYAEKDNAALIVDSVGRDAQSALTKDDWIEILDEARALAGRPGFFARISDVNGNRVSLGEILHPDTLDPLTNSDAPDLSLLPSAGLVRRWEGGAPVEIAAGAWIALENGVQASFSAGRYATGEHWLVPARSISASIEWPMDEATGAAALLPPSGVAHHYCALALGTLAPNGSWALTDCRNLFPPLTALRSFVYLGGDGQEAMPDPLNPSGPIALDAELRVGVVRGRTPVAGASVEFAITAGDGRLGVVADNLKIRKIDTGPDGVARVAWSLDGALQTQQVTARLLDSAGTPTHAPIVFTASLSRAAEVSFDPANTPALAGENTVQGAIEKLAGLQQIGCSTYVIVEGSDWVSVLEGLGNGEDAAICFQRGTYETDRTVFLKQAGHLTISGAGSGTRIIAKRTECALYFDRCASVTLHDFDVSAPDGSGALDNISGRLGAVTIMDSPEVDVSDLDLRCGAGPTAERTCLTIAGAYEIPKNGQSEAQPVDRPLASVRVLRNRLWVGLGQDGLLVSHAVNTLIADNEIEVIVGKGRGLSPERRFEDKTFRRKLVEILVANPKGGEGRGQDGKKVIEAGEYRVEFESLVPQGEWDAFVAAHAPTATEMRSQRGMEAYVERLTGLAIDDPKALPRFEGAIKTLGGRRGADRLIEDDVKRTMVFASEPKVGRVEAPAAGEGKVLVQAGNASLEFGSPVNQADWNSALRLMPVEGVINTTDLQRHVEKIAVRLIADAQFRERLGSARSWYERLTSALPTHGRQAIVCGGKTLDQVSVRGNRIYGFVEGVHIGTSYKSTREAAASMAGIVNVTDNNLFLRKPNDEIYCPMGLFVGNVQTARIERNTLDWAGGPMPVYSNGIRVWGHIGRYLMISENRIATAYVGIRVRSIANVPDKDWKGYLWVAADNLVENVPASRVVRAPPFLRSRDNRPD